MFLINIYILVHLFRLVYFIVIHILFWFYLFYFASQAILFCIFINQTILNSVLYDIDCILMHINYNLALKNFFCEFEIYSQICVIMHRLRSLRSLGCCFQRIKKITDLSVWKKYASNDWKLQHFNQIFKINFISINMIYTSLCPSKLFPHKF